MENFALQEKIRAYVAGELNPEEMEALRREAAKSPELAEELRFSKKLNQALTHKDLLEVRGIIGGIIALEGLPPDASATGTGWGWRGLLWGLLAATALSVGVYVTGNQLDWWQSSAQRLANQYLQPMENVLFTEQADMSADDLRLGMEAYDRMEYDVAVERLNRYYTQTKDANVGLFLGISHLLNGQAQKALLVLQVIDNKMEGPAQEAARWYLALAYLQNGDSQKATAILQALPADGLYGAVAQKLLQDLK